MENREPASEIHLVHLLDLADENEYMYTEDSVVVV